VKKWKMRSRTLKRTEKKKRLKKVTAVSEKKTRQNLPTPRLLSAIFQRERYCWLETERKGEYYAFRAEIAIRLEPAICCEAPSERSIGQQRRFLLPHRARTQTDLLLAAPQWRIEDTKLDPILDFP
jgi:hypothetical protein